MNSKYIKTKRNRNLEAKSFGPFRVLHLVKKQAYKLELSKRWRIHDISHVSLLEQNTTKKEPINKRVTKLEAGDSEEYKVEAIWNSAVYARESELGQLPDLYYLVAWYLVAWKGYLKEENT